MSQIKDRLKQNVPFYTFYRRCLHIYINIFRELRFIFVVFVRARRPVSKWLKKNYPAKYWIHLEVTYDCNLKCDNCNRFCSQAPSGAYLSIEQVEKFIEESIDNNAEWKKIIISGGEPTLHTDILQIVNLLLAYKRKHSTGTIIEFQTNGYGKRANYVLSRMPCGIEIVNSLKESNAQLFHPVNLAPIDSVLYRGIDFSMGCDAVPECGICLTPYGYYPCPIGAAIDRVFGFDIGRKRMPESSDPMLEMLPKLCRFCGAFRFAVRTRKQKTSRSWKAALERYRAEKPSMTRY